MMFESRTLRRLTLRTLLPACLLATCCCLLPAQPDGGGPPDGGPPPGGDMQSQPSRGPSVDRELKQLTHLLALSSDQQTQVKAILTDQNSKMEALFKQARSDSPDTQAGPGAPPDSDTMDKLRAQMDAIRQDANTKIAAVLTDDQKNKFAVWLDKHSKQNGDMPPPPPDGGGGPPPDGGAPPSA